MRDIRGLNVLHYCGNLCWVDGRGEGISSYILKYRKNTVKHNFLYVGLIVLQVSFQAQSYHQAKKMVRSKYLTNLFRRT